MDTTINWTVIVGLANLVFMAGGVLMVLGAFRQRAATVEAKVVELVQKFDGVADQITKIRIEQAEGSSVLTRLAGLETEETRTRDRLHTLEGAREGTARIMEGVQRDVERLEKVVGDLQSHRWSTG